MPELPEVETIKNYLIPKYEGKTVSLIEPLNPRQIVGDLAIVADQKITRFDRHGKVMLILLSNESAIQIHLKMSGRISFWPNIHTRAIIHFADAPSLYFNDPRKFGWVKVDNKLHISKGIDCLDKKFTLLVFKKIIERSRKNIKTLLLDQTVMAGIGNIYANDALWESKISPLRVSNTLSAREMEKLYNAIVLVLADGIKHGGSSKTYVYRLPDGQKGDYQSHFRVYAQEGKQCARCKTEIKRISQSGRSTWYCTNCQK